MPSLSVRPRALFVHYDDDDDDTYVSDKAGLQRAVMLQGTTMYR